MKTTQVAIEVAPDVYELQQEIEIEPGDDGPFFLDFPDIVTVRGVDVPSGVEIMRRTATPAPGITPSPPRQYRKTGRCRRCGAPFSRIGRRTTYCSPGCGRR